MSLQVETTHFPFTSSLPFVGELFDPTCGKVEKIAIAIFSVLLVFPLVAALITLVLDAGYNVYQCLFPNLTTEETAVTVSFTQPPEIHQPVKTEAEEELATPAAVIQPVPTDIPTPPKLILPQTPVAQITALPAVQQLLPPPTDEEKSESIFSPVDEVSGAEVQEIVAYEKSEQKAFFDNVHSWFFDPGNPEKGKKYIFALDKAREALREHSPSLKKLLPALAKHKSPFAKSAFCALNELKEIRDTEIRFQYNYVLKQLRQALLAFDKETDGQVAELVQTLDLLRQVCHFKFTRVAMYPFFEDFISKALRAPQQAGDGYELPVMNLQTLSEEIANANHRLKTCPPAYKQQLIAKEFKKFKGTVGWGFDPTADSNTPWVHSVQEALTENGPKQITVLRHGTPTSDPNLFWTLVNEAQNAMRWVPGIGQFIPSPKPAIVIPEFEAHLAANPNKITLYVNHQEYDDTGEHAVHGEGSRSQAIQQLELKHPNFHFLYLPLDGPFWKKKYLEAVTMAQLKTDLAAAIKHSSPELLEFVHNTYFSGQELTTVAEKKAFIMLFYSELKDQLKNALNVDFIVSACKDNKDRGNASTMVDMIKNIVKLGLENTPEALREVFFSILAPFIIKNEPIIEERLELALHVINHFAHLTEAQKLTLRNSHATGYKIQKQSVPKEEKGWAQMVGEEPFIKMVENMQKLQEIRVVNDPHFQANVASTYFKNGQWNEERLEHQIRRDLPCIDLQFDGERITDYQVLSEKLNHNLPFMAMLHQGVAAEAMRDAATYLGGNRADLQVAMPKNADHYVTQILITSNGDKLNLKINQELELRHPEGRRKPFPIQASIFVSDQKTAKLSWKFS